MVRVFIVEPTRIIVRISVVAANWSSAIATLISPCSLRLCGSLRQAADAPSLRDAARTSLPLR
ncbi:MAG: hypothetical protein V7L11_27210 [Nostoc sp.]|uniref:hypothetical protein n=1 Tax=Nostoc sp. TaxID=1180 RepID=UPI002FFBB298